MLRPRFRKPHRLCRPGAALKNPVSLPSLRRARAQLSRRLVEGSGVRRKGWMHGEPWPFWEGWVGRCGGKRGTWWPQDGEGVHTLAGEEERDGEAQWERAWAFQGEKNHTTEGDSNGVRRRGAWATPPQEPLDGGRGWRLLCHRQALGCLAEAQQGPPRLWPDQAPQRPQLAQTKP